MSTILQIPNGPIIVQYSIQQAINIIKNSDAVEPYFIFNFGHLSSHFNLRLLNEIYSLYVIS